MIVFKDKRKAMVHKAVSFGTPYSQLSKLFMRMTNITSSSRAMLSCSLNAAFLKLSPVLLSTLKDTKHYIMHNYRSKEKDFPILTGCTKKKLNFP